MDETGDLARAEQVAQPLFRPAYQEHAAVQTQRLGLIYFAFTQASARNVLGVCHS
jgi:hypothetical protein